MDGGAAGEVYVVFGKRGGGGGGKPQKLWIQGPLLACQRGGRADRLPLCCALPAQEPSKA